MTAAHGRVLALVAICGACGAQPQVAEQRATQAPCEPPLEFEWRGPLESPPSFDGPPACEGVSFELPGAGLVLLAEGEPVYTSDDAADALAFRDRDGFGMVTADWEGQYYLHLPGQTSRFLIGHAPDTSRGQWGIDGVNVGPDGWWIWTWATWIGDHRSEHPPRLDVVFVPRSTLEPVAVTWPPLNAERVAMQPVEGGLDVAVNRGEARGSWRLQERWVPECAPPSSELVEPPPRCASRPREQGMCFGRC